MRRELGTAVFNKHTGEPTALTAGSRSVLMEHTEPWEHVRLDIRDCPPYENPDLVLQTHVIAMKADSGVTRAEWQQSARWRTQDFRRGEIVIFPAGELSKWRSDEHHTATVVFLDPRLLTDAAADMGWSPPLLELITQVGVSDELLYGCLAALERETFAGCPNEPLYGDTIAYTISTHLLSHYSSSPQTYAPPKTAGLPSRALKDVTDYIAANYARPIKISELAKISHLSTYHFSRLFKHSTGVSPYRYLLNHRVQRALELLSAGHFTYKEVARIVGFYDVSHFVRVFKKITGFNPGEARGRTR